jgi:GNAT superfamily N-acetyltransferase
VDLTFELPDADDAELKGLVAEQQAEIADRYDNNEDHDPPVHADARYLLMRDGGQAIGCAAVQPLEPRIGELKRMYIVPDERGRGLGRALLRAVEDLAKVAGYEVLRLETGWAQPEAVALYDSAGYSRITPYGYWKDEPGSICFEKSLTTAPPPSG